MAAPGMAWLAAWLADWLDTLAGMPALGMAWLAGWLAGWRGLAWPGMAAPGMPWLAGWQAVWPTTPYNTICLATPSATKQRQPPIDNSWWV